MITLTDGPLAGQRLQTWTNPRQGGGRLVEGPPRAEHWQVVWASAPAGPTDPPWPTRFYRYELTGGRWRYRPLAVAR